jgi:anaerobic C4-dicarboxylate transporter
VLLTDRCYYCCCWLPAVAWIASRIGRHHCFDLRAPNPLAASRAAVQPTVLAHSPLTAALAILLGVAVPHGLVTHVVLIRTVSTRLQRTLQANFKRVRPGSTATRNPLYYKVIAPAGRRWLSAKDRRTLLQRLLLSADLPDHKPIKGPGTE